MDRDETPPSDPEAADRARIRSLQPLRPAVLHILEAIASGQEHGYAIMRHVERSSAGAVRLGPGTLYGSLGRMQEQGLVRERQERPEQTDDDPRRRYYRLTELGEAVLDAEVRRLSALVQRARARLEGVPR